MTRRKLTVLIAALALLAGLGAGAIVLIQPGERMTDAAQRFLKSLDDEQRKTATMNYDDPKRLDWHFIPKAERKGLELNKMNEAQRREALALLRSALSQVGYDKSRTIMELESILKALQSRPNPARDPLKYYVTIFGEPKADAKWGLSFEGHHLSLNFVVDDNQVVSHSPAFFGGNPNIVTSDVKVGPVRGTYALANEEILAFELINLLDDEQRKAAMIADKAPRDIRAAGSTHPPADAPAGIAGSKLNNDQMHKLWALIHVYAHNMPKPVADRRLKEIADAGFDKVHFAWAGATKPGVGHYYRVQGPTFLIELCNVQPDAAGNPAAHPHAVWRDMRGDFGIKRND